MRHLRSALKVWCLLGSSLVFPGCFAGGLAALYPGEIWAVNTAADAIRRASTESSPGSPDAGFVTSSLSDPPSRATAGSSFSIRDAVLPVIVIAGHNEPLGITHYHLSFVTTLPLRADKRLLGSRNTESESTVILTIPDDTVPGLYRLVACPRELLPEDGPVAAGCLVSPGIVIVEAVGSAEPVAAGAMHPSAPVEK